MKDSALEKYVGLAKDMMVLFRDGAIIVLAILLLAFPLKFNAILVEAGFEEGSVVGFKWKSKLVESNEALEKATASIAALTKENNELLATLEKTQAELNSPTLKARFVDLQKQNVTVKSQTEAVQSIVQDTIEANDPLIQKSRLSSNQRNYKHADYTVGLQTVGVEDSDRIKLNAQISNRGYTLDKITYSYESGSRPSWFSRESSVFYYSSSARGAAEELAELMKQLTGKKFTVRRGGGLGVDPAKKHLTFFIHMLE